MTGDLSALERWGDRLRIAARVLLALGVLLGLTAFWIAPTAQGHMPGVYWLFWVFNRGTLPVTAITIVTFVASLMVWVLLRRRRSDHTRRALLTTGLLLVAVTVLMVASFFAMLTDWQHRGSARIEGRVYYLASDTAFIDEKFYLLRCGPLGVVCRGIYITRDFPVSYITQASIEPGRPPFISLCADDGFCDTFQLTMGDR